MPEPEMTNRALAYGGVGFRLTVPDDIWQRSLAILRAYGSKRSEGLVLWGGVVNAAGAYVTGLYIPRHAPQGARAALAAEESRWLLRRLSGRDEKLLAQMHSHPGEAFHSDGDNDGATSFHAGFISIVAPNFSRGVDHLSQCAVFEYDSRTFCMLDRRAVETRLRVISLVEDRVPPTDLPETKSWFSTIVSSLRQKLTGWKRRWRS